MAEGRRPSSVVMFRCRTEPCEEIHGSGGLRVSRHESTTTAKGCCWPANGGGVCNSCGEAVGCLGHLRCVVLLLLVGGTCGWKEGVCPPRHVQIDLGVYYCDTLQLFKYLPASVVPSGHQWEVWGFEATPYIATFAQKCAAALSRGMPLPPKPATSRTRGTSPSEEDLASRFRAAKMPKHLHFCSKLKISKSTRPSKGPDPKTPFGGANLAKPQNSSKFSLSLES